MVELLGAAQKAPGQFGCLPGIAAPEPPHPVAVAVVPFGEGGGKTAQLIAARPDVPGLGDQLDAGQHRILPQRIEKAALRVKAMGLAPQHGGQIEAEAIDMAVLDPVAQRIHHQAQDRRPRQVQRVAGSGVVHILPPAMDQPVIARIVQTPERQRRPPFVALAGVVIDHIQNDLDPGGMQRLDRALELGQRIAQGQSAARA